MSLWVWSVDWLAGIFWMRCLNFKTWFTWTTGQSEDVFFLPCDFWLNYNLCNHSWDSPDHLLFPLDNAVFWSFAFTARRVSRRHGLKSLLWVTPPWMVISHTHWLSYLEWCSHSYQLHFYFFIFCFSGLYIYCLYINTFMCSLPAVMAPLCSDKEPHAVFSFPFRILLIKFAFV